MDRVSSSSDSDAHNNGGDYLPPPIDPATETTSSLANRLLLFADRVRDPEFRRAIIRAANTLVRKPAGGRRRKQIYEVEALVARRMVMEKKAKSLNDAFIKIATQHRTTQRGLSSYAECLRRAEKKLPTDLYKVDYC